jgi:hypothetical protein
MSLKTLFLGALVALASLSVVPQAAAQDCPGDPGDCYPQEDPLVTVKDLWPDWADHYLYDVDEAQIRPIRAGLGELQLIIPEFEYAEGEAVYSAQLLGEVFVTDGVSGNTYRVSAAAEIEVVVFVDFDDRLGVYKILMIPDYEEIMLIGDRFGVVYAVDLPESASFTQVLQ